jgi:hypothetical protein
VGFCLHLELVLNNKILELTASLEELTIEMNSVQEALKKEEAGKIVRTYHLCLHVFHSWESVMIIWTCYTFYY